MAEANDTEKAKLQRARKHIAEVVELVDAYLGARPIEVRRDFNVVSGTFKIESVVLEQYPIELSLAVGDAIHNLRSALDHTYFDLVRPFVRDEKDAKRVQFPTWSSPDFEEQTLTRCLATAAGAEFVAAIKELQPYPGGAKGIYELHSLDVEDKHKTLPLVGLSIAIAGDRVNELGPARYFGHWRAAGTTLRFKTGMPAFITTHVAKDDPLWDDRPYVRATEYQPAFLIALDEPGFMGESIGDRLRRQADDVEAGCAALRASLTTQHS